MLHSRMAHSGPEWVAEPEPDPEPALEPGIETEDCDPGNGAADPLVQPSSETVGLLAQLLSVRGLLEAKAAEVKEAWWPSVQDAQLLATFDTVGETISELESELTHPSAELCSEAERAGLVVRLAVLVQSREVILAEHRKRAGLFSMFDDGINTAGLDALIEELQGVVALPDEPDTDETDGADAEDETDGTGDDADGSGAADDWF